MPWAAAADDYGTGKLPAGLQPDFFNGSAPSMMIAKKYRSVLLLLLAAIPLGSFLISFLPGFFIKGTHLVNVQLRSSIEALGAMTAASMSLLLLQFHRDGQREKGEFFPLSMGFLMMGILDAFAAVSTPGHGFNLLHNFRSVFGGLWFVLVWLPGSGNSLSRSRAVPYLVACISALIGIIVLRFRDSFPQLVEHGELTVLAICISVTAGIFFIAAALYFLLEFLRTSTLESYLFTCVFVLVGLSTCESRLTSTWTENWWFWYIQRLIAYVVAYYYMLRSFLRVRNKLEELNRTLEMQVTERTAALSVEVAERQRYAQESDELIVELQEALARINTLTGLLPTCSSCKKIKDADGRWTQMELYIQNHSEAKFSHGLCPTCTKKLYPDIYDKLF
jgi:hypothetical protein